MTDELDDLKRAFDAATPAPDAARKADTLSLAQKNFETLQGSQAEPRPMTEPRKSRDFVKGVFTMLQSLNTRAGLTATTALAAVALIAIVPVLQDSPPLKLSEDSSRISHTIGTPIPTTELPQPEIADRAAAPLANISPAPSPKTQTSNRLRLQSHELQFDGFGRFGGPITSQELLLVEPGGIQGTLTEAYPEADPNGVKVTAQDPVSTFSIDVDTASYGIIRNSLMSGQVPPKNAVRLEEMVNYFPYDYTAPKGDMPFSTSLAMMDAPWRPGAQILRIALQGQRPQIKDRPPLNLVFLIDTSGSMNQPNKLPLLKQSLRLMLSQLRPEDQIAIVAYAGSAGQVLAPTPASDRADILQALDNLNSGGSTAGQDGLEQAYALAAKMHDDGDVSRVLLATDGDFNVGLSDPDALKTFIANKRESGTYLSVLGFGRGNLDDATMQALAQNGNGFAAYIDSLPEAQKVLVDQLSGALFTIAEDVKLQVEFNPAAVAEYRLLGYETRALAREDFNNDKVDAGEIGAGHQVTALYEIVQTGSQARRTDALRYRTREDVQAGRADELGFLKLRYKAPGAETSQLMEVPIPRGLAADDDLRFAAAIAGFGEVLRSSELLGDWSLDDAHAAAQAARGADPYGYRAEALQLMRLAQALSE